MTTQLKPTVIGEYDVWRLDGANVRIGAFVTRLHVLELLEVSSRVPGRG